MWALIKRSPLVARRNRARTQDDPKHTFSKTLDKMLDRVSAEFFGTPGIIEHRFFYECDSGEQWTWLRNT